MDEALKASWTITTKLLEIARALLPHASVSNNKGGSIRGFDDNLYEHNELELALDELESLAEVNPCPPEFFRKLLAAAENMGLAKHAERYREKLRVDAK